ncbi:MAG: AAA family ATPase [Myxococcales bacterium]|nr:AAA family ATPase [Myxococcales bacterium]
MNLDELHARLRAAWGVARAGEGAVLHVVGPVGAGRSTVLGRFLESVDGPDERAAVVSARCGDEDRVQSSERGVLEELIARVAEGVRAIVASHEGDEAEGDAGDVPWLLPGADFLQAATGIAALPVGAGGMPTPPRARIHADLLLDIAREHPVLVVLDDVHRADDGTRALIRTLAEAVAADDTYRLLLVLASAPPLREAEAPVAVAWTPTGAEVLALGPRDAADLAEQARARLARYGEPSPTLLKRLAEAAHGNPMVLDALVGLAEGGGAFKRKGPLDDPKLGDRPGFAGLHGLARGLLPSVPAHVLADLQAAAVAGARFETDLLAKLWSVPAAAARLRIDALVATGLVRPRPERWGFVSAQIAAHYAATLPEAERRDLHARLGALLRAMTRLEAGADRPRTHLDVTETWSENRRRDHRQRVEQERLWAAVRHFAQAGRHAAAAEAAVTLVERLFETSGGYSYLAGRFGRRADRARRHRIYAALTEASTQLDRARGAGPADDVDQELLAINVRLMTVHARFKEVMGDFAEARRSADTAVELGAHLPEPAPRLEAMRVRVEVCYAAGENNAGRQALVQLMNALADAPRDDAVRVYGWLAESIGRWEWVGLHGRLFPFLLERLSALGADREAIKARMEWLTAAMEVDDSAASEAMLVEVTREAERTAQTPYLAELLALYAADLLQGQVDAHFDALSGEFYPPDLFGDGQGPPTPALPERLGRPVELLTRAEVLSESSGSKIAHLRVLTTMLGLIYETRERFADLLDRWMPVHRESRPVRLAELLDALEHGFFDVDHIEAISERTLLMAQEMGLDQVLADTVYEALDRELPGAARRADTLFELTRKAYERVGDAYGLITLSLVRLRHLEQANKPLEDEIAAGVELLDTYREQLTAEQRAFVHWRYGELFLGRDDGLDDAVAHLEQAIRLYDQVGDVEHLQSVGDLLREVYRKQGDLGRYRSLRERFRALEQRVPGVDPLGLELRVEHLLNLARQEPDDERAIAMVERCVQLFSRMPDGTTRIDECFVEISKICRRRADEAQSEGGFHDWLQRSLDAVRVATQINRGLNNYHRVFEEFHELFDDLLGLGAYDEYLRVRAESRELAFAVGNVAELMYLFDEHLQYDQETGFDFGRLPEVRGFYEALVRYLLGLGALEQALATQRAFVRFLTAIGEPELAAAYQGRRLIG